MSSKPDPVADYRHDATRKNNPPAALASQGHIREVPKQRYYYDPHLSPVLRFDDTGESDRLPELLEEATRRKLKPAEESQHSGRRAPKPSALAGVDRQARKALVRGRPRRAPHTRARLRPGRHPQSPPDRTYSGELWADPRAGLPRSRPVLQARRGVVQPPDTRRQPGGHELPRQARRLWPARSR